MKIEADTFISVIIPVFNDWAGVEVCLQALKLQSICSSRFEVIIVDNNSGSPVPPGLEARYDFKLITEKTPGSYSARNAGVGVSKGEILVFTDSDCTPAPNWLQGGLKALSSGVDRVAGGVELTFDCGDNSFVCAHEKAFAFRQEANSKAGWSVTANLMTWKSVFLEVGYFNDSLMSSGDYEWNTRATEAGKSIQFCDDCVVYHPARSNVTEVLKKNKRLMGGQYDMFGFSWARIFRTLVPPFTMLSIIRNNSKLDFREKVYAFVFEYYLKFYRASVLLRRHFKYEESQRV
ncbi:glycosyltransferase [Coraliomargarita sp. W4R72]